MNRDSSLDGVIREMILLLEEAAGAEASLRDVTPDSRVREDLLMDSVAVIVLIDLIEERFGIEFQANDLQSDTFRTVRSIAMAVQRLLS